MKSNKQHQVMQFWLAVSLIFLLMACRSAESLPPPTAAADATLPPPSATSTVLPSTETAVSTSTSQTVSPTATAIPITPTAVPAFPTMPELDPDSTGITGIYGWFNLVNEANDTTPEENLIVFLQYLAGERPYVALFGDNEIDTHGLGALTSMAAELIESSGDEALVTELSRLVDIISPTTERIEAYAAPADSETQSKRNVLSRRTAQDTEECRTLWAEGFPTPPTGVVVPICALYETYTAADGDRYRVYYPSEWADNASLVFQYLPATMDAIVAAEPVFNTYDDFKSANIIFGYLSSVNAWMAVPTRSARATRNEACPVWVYNNSWEGGVTLDIEQFKQSVVHELFHCMQEQIMGPTTNYASAQWWEEGSAEYFSNVVFPDSNFEWRWSGRFDAGSGNVALTVMKYEPTFFFQFLENELASSQAVYDFMKTLPVGGTEADQMAALVRYPNMDDLFHRFALAYFDGAILDTSGSQIPFSPQINDVDRINGRTDTILSVTPFIIGRYEVLYEQGFRWDITYTEDGLSGQRSARELDGSAVGVWTAWPQVVSTSCEARQKLFVMTSTAPSIADEMRVRYQPTVEEAEDDSCDTCVQGIWAIDRALTFTPETIQRFAASRLPGAPEFESEEGSVLLTFAGNNVVLDADTYHLKFRHEADPSTFFLDMTFNGLSAGSFIADGNQIGIFYDTRETGASAVLTTGSETLPVGAELMGMLFRLEAQMMPVAGDTLAYSCTPDLLTFTAGVEGSPYAGEVVYRRLD